MIMMQVLWFPHKVYKSSWTMVKIIYLTCRFTVLMLWPLVVYVYVNDHSADNCSPWTYPQTLIYLVLVISFVFVPLHTFDIGWCSRLPPIVSLYTIKNSWRLLSTLFRSSAVAHLGVHREKKTRSMGVFLAILRLPWFNAMGQYKLHEVVLRNPLWKITWSMFRVAGNFETQAWRRSC